MKMTRILCGGAGAVTCSVQRAWNDLRCGLAGYRVCGGGGVMDKPWALAKDARKDGKQVLACFRGQFDWVYFVAYARTDGVLLDGYAPAEYWQDLPTPPYLK